MPHYFKPWRRKIGVVTLMMACLFMAGWVRSYAFSDDVTVYYGNQTCGSWESTNGFIARFFPIETDAPASLFPTLNVLPSQHGFDPDDHTNIKWSFKWMGFRSGDIDAHVKHVWIIPYWSIVIPLTLLSVWLLLSTSRKEEIETQN